MDLLTAEDAAKILAMLPTEVGEAPGNLRARLQAVADGAVVVLPNKERRFGCHCDLDPEEMPDGCYLDNGKAEDCVEAVRLLREGKDKWACKEWREIKLR